MSVKPALAVQVEREAGRPEAMPKRFRLSGREVEIDENIDMWHGPSYRYVKVRGGDGNLYILRCDEERGEWELTMFQSPRAEAFARLFHDAKRQPLDG
jgi:hypothetical protein